MSGHAFALTDGTTTVNLHDGTAALTTTYTLASPADGAVDATDNIRLTILGSSFAALQSTLRGIERLLDQANRRQRDQNGPRVFLTAQYDGDTAAWRSEIYNGQLLVENLGQELPRRALEAALIIRRAPWWEGAEVELSISAANQAAATGGRTIYNHTDAGTGHGNWLQIDAAQVLGSLPAPVRVRLTNTSGSAVTYRTLHLGVNAFAAPTTLTSVIEGEDENSARGTDSSDAGSSAGYYWTSTAGAGSDVLLGRWPIVAATVTAGAGRWFHLLARGYGSNATIWPVIYDASGLNIIWTGAVQTINSANPIIIDLGAVPIPPGVYDPGNAPIMLGLWGRANAIVDFFQLLGVDAYRRLVIPSTMAAVSVANNEYLELDEGEGRAYANTSAGHHARVSMQGRELVLFPGVTQRLYVLVDEYAGMTIANTFAAQIWARPRRLSL